MQKPVAAGAVALQFAASALAESLPAPPGNDIAASAETRAHIELGQTVAGVLEAAGDKDWYATDLKRGGAVWVMLITGSTDTLRYPLVQVYNAGGSPVYGHPVGPRDDEGFGEDNFVFVFTPDANGRYFIEAQGSDENGQPGAGNYALSLGMLGNPTQNEEVAPGDWQASFPAFASRVIERKAKHGPVFQMGTFFALRTLSSQGCASERANMPGFLPVQFPAEFRAMEPTNESQRWAHKADLRIRVDIDGDDRSDPVGTFVYLAADSVDAWRNVTEGTKVRFTANVNCIVNIYADRTTRHFVTLHDARPVVAASATPSH